MLFRSWLGQPMQFDRLKRREFITLLGGAAVWPMAARAQQGGRTYRIGFLTGSFAGNLSNVTAIAYPEFRAELRKRGFIDGRNLVVEIRSTLQERGKLFADVAELVSSNVDLIVASGPEVAVQAALAASPTVPVVMWANNFDPIARGYVQSLAGRVAASPASLRASRNWPPNRSRY